MRASSLGLSLLLAAGCSSDPAPPMVQDPTPVTYQAPVLRSLGVLATAVAVAPGEVLVAGTGGMARLQDDDGVLEIVSADGGFSMMAVAVLDVNGDAAADHAFATTGGIRLRLANGTGGYAPPDEDDDAIGVAATALVAGDLDGDGHDDLIATTAIGHTVLWGDGVTLAATEAVAGPIAHAAIGDLDGDGRDELVLAAGAELRIVRYGAARELLDSVIWPDSATAISALAVVDLDGDSAADLVIGQRGEAGVRMVLGPLAAVPVERAARDFPAHPPTAFAAGDLDADGDLDLAALLEDGQGLVLLDADPEGLIARDWIGAGSDPVGVVIADLGGGPTPELVVVGRRYAAIVPRDGAHWSGADAERAAEPGTYDALAVGDVDADGETDLVSSRGGTVTAHLGTGEVVELSTGTAPQLVGVGDFDGDDRDDAVVIGPAGPVVFTERLTVPQVVPFPLAPSSVAIGDLDGDDRDEVVVADSLGGRVVVFRAEDEPLVIVVDGVPVTAALGDLDEDGTPEIIVSRAASDRISVFSAAGESLRELSLAAPGRLTVGDLDGDGHLDVAVITGELAQEVSTFRGDGTGALEPVDGDLPLEDAAAEITAVDLDRDGQHELLVLLPAIGATVLLRDDPDTGTPTRTLFAVTALARVLAVGDRDGDGLPDLTIGGLGLTSLKGQALP